MQDSYSMPVYLCRKISTKADEEQNIRIYSGQAPITAFINLPDDENVREYIVGSGKINKKSSVHRAIEDTLLNRPDKFPILNSGITIVSKSFDYDEKKQIITLKQPSIINGSQTRGVIREFVETRKQDTFDFDTTPKVKYEIIVTEDEDLVSETSIARNNQIQVKQISILGARQVFEELGNKLNKDYQTKKKKTVQIRESETDRGDEYIPTEKLLQVIASLIPDGELWKQTGRNEYSKVFCYSSQASSLRLFEKIYKERDNATKDLYEFYLDIAFDAWELYLKWTSHPGFGGTWWKKGIGRDGNTIISVSDGILFPILSAHAAFILKDGKKWLISLPDAKNIDKDLINTAKQTFQEMAHYKVENMGRTRGCYMILYTLAHTVARYRAREKESVK